jgi:mannosyltransferase OCH1-like enzyme
MIIPKIFHRIWLGGNPMPEEFEYYGETWIKNHPDWQMKLWTEDNIPPLMNQKEFDNEQSMAGKADILRFELLNYYGGVYIDTDFECYKNIEPLIKDLDCFMASEHEGTISIGIIGAVPKHPIIQKIIEALPGSIRKNKHQTLNIKSGPAFVTKLLKVNELTVFSEKYFYPTKFPFNQKPNMGHKYPDAVANHHWAMSWMTAQLKRDWGVT